MRLPSTFLAIAALSLPSAALAHVKVTASTPAAGTTAKGVRTVTLNFSEALLPPTTATEIVMTAMPGMANHGKMVIRNYTSAWSNTNRTLTLQLRQPLKAGDYSVRWQAAGADGHRMKGSVEFVAR